eukprot:CAMPEP_0117673714 /NCGR_PEP_ID=MMETSP0804-20121206/14625_1 /TAXON_ID=1074897 /ORGANISM="Tetraselmis astigmatica, Strain CCMP880" /LENGTH=368 /DNA_ID=CAMNT_0005482481 /DNA_START=218 /DNA_END=1324 /DNA_ORIENTATION=+
MAKRRRDAAAPPPGGTSPDGESETAGTANDAATSHGHRQGFGAVAEAVMPSLESPVSIAEAVLQSFPQLFDTSTSAKKSVRRGEVWVDDVVRKSGWKINGGETLQIWQRITSGQQLPAVEVPKHLKMEVLYESDTWAAVLKPQGVPTVVPSEPGGWTAERMLPYFLASTTAPGALWRPKAVHRLDSATSGVLCCGKARAALKELSQAFAQRLTTKRYRALLVGHLEGDGIIDTPLLNRDTGAMQEAVTRYAVVKHTRSLRWGWLTTVDLWPKTGRTHQLRRHMKGLGYPILGDPKYGGPNQTVEGEGLFLFAAELTVPDPDVAAPGAEQSMRTLSADEAAKFERTRRLEQSEWDAGGQPEPEAGQQPS